MAEWFALWYLYLPPILLLFWWRWGKKYNRADWGLGLTNCFDGWARWFCRRYHRMQDLQLALPETGGAIVISNHTSGLDPLLLVSASNRPLRFLIAKEEYERFGLRWFFKLAGCIPVDRGGRVDKAFREAIRQVQQGEVVALFPHGKIHLDSEAIAKIKPGLRKLVAKVGCPVLPVRITGVAGQGDVFTGVVLRGKVKLSTFPMLSATQFEQQDIDVALGELLLGRRASLLPKTIEKVASDPHS